MRKESIEIGSKWQHFKGDIMEVFAIAKHSETLEDMVIYKHLDTIWARPIASFLSEEDVRERKDNVTHQTYRFEKIRKEEKE